MPAGYYVWREQGQSDGRCLGLDMRQAQPLSPSQQWVPYVYDAAMTMMRGLHAYIESGGDIDKLTGKALFNAMTNVSFEGKNEKIV